MLLTTLILAGTLARQPAQPPTTLDADHRFLRTFWTELMQKDNYDAKLQARGTRDISRERADGPAITLEKPAEVRIPD